MKYNYKQIFSWFFINKKIANLKRLAKLFGCGGKIIFSFFNVLTYISLVNCLSKKN